MKQIKVNTNTGIKFKKNETHKLMASPTSKMAKMFFKIESLSVVITSLFLGCFLIYLFWHVTMTKQALIASLELPKATCKALTIIKKIVPAPNREAPNKNA